LPKRTAPKKARNAADKPPVDIASLPTLDRAALAELWLKAYGHPLPAHLRREVVILCLAYRLQERAQGGLSERCLRELKAITSAKPRGRRDRPALRVPSLRARLKPGTRLLRTWRGTTHTVTVESEGFAWKGKRYRSLSVIASEITGAHWSDPAFFGLNRPRIREPKRATPPITLNNTYHQPDPN
jgi:hypothetical protein